jgi:hypothetical protein
VSNISFQTKVLIFLFSVIFIWVNTQNTQAKLKEISDSIITKSWKHNRIGGVCFEREVIDGESITLIRLNDFNILRQVI